MIKISGKYASAAVYSCTAEDYALAQIQIICDSPAALGSKIRVMPDVHPGKVGAIGLRCRDLPCSTAKSFCRSLQSK